jgi:uroporphyrinogen decarboxylase
VSTFLDLFQAKKEGAPPVWFMRQAGRSLPEYREVRKQCGSFLDLCYTPHLAAQVTLQPVERFNVDAAILFSDILVVPQALGQRVWFQDGEGPHLDPISLSSFDKTLSFSHFLKNLSPVYEAISLVKKNPIPLIGFSGAPWTLALYMLQGEGSRDFAKAKQSAFQDEDAFLQLLAHLEKAISLHLIEQANAGVDVVQLFDSWAGLCPATHFKKWILEPTQAIINTVRQAHPTLPVIGFPRGLGLNMLDYGKKVSLSALSLDSSVPISLLNKELPTELIFQGNLDPSLLVVGGDPLKRGIEQIKQDMRGRPYIFNLGHGVLPHTPISHIESCLKWVRE